MAVRYKHNVSKTQMCIKYHNIKNRCYNEKYHEINPKYKDCEICPEWLDNKYNFYDWMRENYYTVNGETMDIDKDIMKKGNKIYSPETCIFVPHSINVYFEHITRNPKYLSKTNVWRMDICVEGKNMNIGYYDTEHEAKEVYIKHKEALILAKADLYKSKIPRKIYNAMVNWKIELTDWDN